MDSKKYIHRFTGTEVYYVGMGRLLPEKEACVIYVRLDTGQASIMREADFETKFYKAE